MSYVLLSEVTHTARKPHRCIWCYEGIPAGTRYVRERSVFDGEPQSLKWHPECRDDANEWFREVGESEFCPGDNPRPLSAALLEFASWDCSLLLQRSI